MKSTVLSKTSFFIYAGLIFILAGCGGSSKKEGGSEEFEASKKQLQERVDKVIHSLPPPSLLPFAIKRKGVPYAGNLVNPLDDIEDYLTSNSKSAMILGIYASDIGYLSSYGFSDEARAYMEKCQQLSDRLGIATAIDQDVINRFQQNTANPDSLLEVINVAMERVEDRLEDLDELKLASLALSGSFIEGLYISTQSLMRMPSNTTDKASLTLEVLRLVAEQHVFLLDLKSLLKDTERDDVINKFIDDTETLDILFDNFKDYLDELKEGGTPDLSNPAVSNFIKEVSRVRGEVIES